MNESPTAVPASTSEETAATTDDGEVTAEVAEGDGDHALLQLATSSDEAIELNEGEASAATNDDGQEPTVASGADVVAASAVVEKRAGIKVAEDGESTGPELEAPAGREPQVATVDRSGTEGEPLPTTDAATDAGTDANASNDLVPGRPATSDGTTPTVDISAGAPVSTASNETLDAAAPTTATATATATTAATASADVGGGPAASTPVGVQAGVPAEASSGVTSGPPADPSTAADPAAGNPVALVAPEAATLGGHDSVTVGRAQDSGVDQVVDVAAPATGAPDQAADDATSRTFNLPGDALTERAARSAEVGSSTSPATLELSDEATDELWGQVQRALNRARSSQTGSELRLRLRPAELGELLVQVRTVGDQLAVRLVTSSVSAQQVLLNDQSRLAAELAAAGFEDGSFDISHEGQQNGGSGSSTGQRSGSDRQPSTPSGVSAPPLAAAARLDRSIAAATTGRQQGSVELKL